MENNVVKNIQSYNLQILKILMQTMIQKNANLEELKKSVLERAFSGKL